MKVLIVDDHPLFLSGLRALFEAEKELEVCGEATNGQEAISLAHQLKPDIVIMDINMPDVNGIEATRNILSTESHTKILALSIHSDKQYVQEMLDAGAVGYLLKDDAPEELLRAVKKVAEGDMYLSSTITRAALLKREKLGEANGVNVLASKLHPPPQKEDYVLRTKIIEELESNINNPLALVSGGPGFGKSVVTSQWLAQSKQSNSWISLDKEHNDLRTFLCYLITATEKVRPGLLQNTADLIAGTTLPPSPEIADTVIQDFCENEEKLILVLDNYQVINERGVHDLFDKWLQYPPPHVHLCLVTRRDPPLAINYLKLSGRVTMIRGEDLSFDEAEIADLFKQVKHIDLEDEASKLLHENTEGWIIALRLILMIIKDKEEILQFLSAIGKGKGANSIFSYLLEEVMSKQPPHIQDQLVESSVLKRFSEPLIDAVSGKDQKAPKSKQEDKDLIQWLTESNLFIVTLDSDQTWYRYHHLFHVFLLSELAKRKSALQVNQLHTRASQWFGKNGMIDDAVYHAIRGGNTSCAEKIIKENFIGKTDSYGFHDIERWLSLIPEETIDTSVTFLICTILVACKRYRCKQIPFIIEQLEGIGDPLDDTEAGFLAYAKGIDNLLNGNGKRAQECFDQAIQLIPGKHLSFRAEIWTYWSWSMQIQGNGAVALRKIRDHIKKLGPKEMPKQLSCYRSHICDYYLLNANLKEFKNATTQYLSTINPGYEVLAPGDYIRTMLYWWENKISGAIRELESFNWLNFATHSRSGIDAHVCKALALQEIGRAEEASELISSAIEYAENSGEAKNMEVALSGRARLNLRQDNTEESEAWLNTTEPGNLNPSMYFWVEVPSITYCRVLIAIGSSESLRKAVALLEQYRKYSETIHYTIRIIEIAVLQSVAYSRLELNKEASESIRHSVELAVPGNWIRPFTESFREVSGLLQELKTNDIFPKFIDQITESVEQQKEHRANAEEEARDKKRKEKEDAQTVLTTSEMRVLICLAEGLRNREIADKLFNSEDTIKKHIYNMFQKLDVKNRLSLVTKAKEQGILD